MRSHQSWPKTKKCANSINILISENWLEHLTEATTGGCMTSRILPNGNQVFTSAKVPCTGLTVFSSLTCLSQADQALVKWVGRMTVLVAHLWSCRGSLWDKQSNPFWIRVCRISQVRSMSRFSFGNRRKVGWGGSVDLLRPHRRCQHAVHVCVHDHCSHLHTKNQSFQ